MPRKILIVDDIMSNRLILKAMLREDYDILEAASGEDALGILSRNREPVSAVLLDISMPGMDGYEVLNRIRSDKRLSQTPVIMITGNEEKDTRVKSLALGANDFVMKPYSSEIIKHCLRNNIALFEASTTVSILEKDRLTGVWNREAFFQRAAREIEGKPAGYYVLGCLDIEGFKVINDQYGSEVGDGILKCLGEALRDSCNELGGICGRIFADQFVGLYPRALLELDRIGPETLEARISGDTGISLTLIVGRYMVSDKSLSVNAMFDRACIAKNTVKGHYDAHVAIYDESMREHILREQKIVNEMNFALAGGQFEVWFQPQYNHSTDAMIGAEALVRWRHPEKGLIPPGDFIPIFEKNGFIYALDKFVWEAVCRYLRKWMDEGRSPLPVSVNISRYDVLRPDIVGVLSGLVRQYDLPMNLLRLEITESTFSESSQRIVDVVNELLKRGFTVEIDDFGSGYSSLNTLKDVPAQVIKLDMKFLESNDDSQRGGNIVESVVRMAKWLGMSVIAEGVETLEQANYLRSIGCNYMQGYLYAKPMPAGKYEEHCSGSSGEERLLTLETVENLDNNAFWDPKSMDTLIFNSYVGGACIYEYHNGKIELLRATEKYAQIIGSAGMTVEDALKLNWAEHLDDESRGRVVAGIEESLATKKEVTGEYIFLDLPNCPHETYLRSTMRVIASAGDSCLVYCTNENITAQRKSEERERLAARQLSAIMGNINGGVTATVIEGNRLRRLFANDVYYKLLGYAKEDYEAQFSGLPDCALPEDRDMVMARARAISASHEPGTIEFRVRRADGEIRWLRSNISVIDYPGESKPVQLSVTADITRQREDEQKIQRVTEQMQAVMDNVDLGVIAAVVSGDTARYIFTNNRYFDMLGYTKEQFEAEIRSAYQTIAPVDRQMVIDETARINKTGESALLVYKAVTRDGHERIFRSAIAMGRLTGIDAPVQFTILRDITEETKAEQREQFVAGQIKGMMDDMPGGFVRMSVSEDGTLKPVYINDGFLTLTDMSREAAMALYADDALIGVHPDDVAIVKDAIARMFENGEAHSARYRLTRGGGGYIWLSVFGRVTKDISGGTYLNIYYTDASEQVKEEETQKDLLDNLPGGAGVYEFKDGRMSLKYQNKSYWQLVGLNEADFVDSAPMSAIHPDDVPIIMRELFLSIDLKRDVVCDIRLRHLTMGYRSVHLVGRVVRKEDGSFSIYATFSPNELTSLPYQQMIPVVLSAIMESTTDLSFAKDANFRYMTASRAFARMVGQNSEHDVIGKTDYDLFEKELADKFRRDDEALLSSGKALIDMTESIPSRDGMPRYSSTSKYLLRDGSGEVIGMYGVGRDITQSVLQSTQLKLINDSVPGGIATYTYKNGSVRIAYCNDGFCELFGGSRAGFEARGDIDPLDWVFEEDRAELLAQIDALVRNALPMDVIFRSHVVGGGFKWINEKASAVEERGDTTRFNALLLDVTERQTINEQLRISEEENNLAVALGGNIVMRYVLADRSLTLSPEIAAAHSLPQTIADVPYEPVRLGLIAHESIGAYVGFFEAIQNGSNAETVLYQQQYLGDWKWMEGRSTTIFSDAGKPVKAVISLRDVTDRIEKETIFRKWQQSLEDRAGESYTLVRCDLSCADACDTREGSLISFDFDGAGSDFNTRIAAYAEQCVCAEDRRRFLAFINSDAMIAGYYRGKRSDALEYRELTPGGASRWLRVTVDLVESPNSTDVEAYMMYEDIDKAKRAELQTKTLSETDPLTGILNRATFAAKVDGVLSASKPGTRHALLMLDIDCFKQVNDVFGHGAGDQALIDLANGLSSLVRQDDFAARLGGDEFMAFLRDIPDDSAALDKAARICAFARRSYSMEVRTSASIGIAFAPRDGANFETLYKKADSALYHVKGSGKDDYAVYRDNMVDENLEPEPDSLDSTGVKVAEKKRRMLIVDDNSIDHAMLRNIFRDEFIIEEAQDGPTALIRLRHYGSAISVVLLDLMMPGMDGFAVLGKMRESAESRSIPVIIVSGDESRETCLEAIRRGATDFITKPVDANLLRLRVRSAISKAENERLRAMNSLLEIQNEERIRYESALDSAGITFVEYNWLTEKFHYCPSISKYLLGVYDARAFWQILLDDMVADEGTVRDMRRLVSRLVDSPSSASARALAELRAPDKSAHHFRVTARKLADGRQFAGRMIIALDDLDCDSRA